MKKALALIIAAALALSLTACGGDSGAGDASTPGESNTGNTDKTGCIVSKGLFVLEPKDGFDLTNEENLSPQEIYMIHVYDIIPDSQKNSEMSLMQYHYTVTLNDANTYESRTMAGGAAQISFVTSSHYTVADDVGTVFAGSDPIRAIAVFRINKNDINENTTVKFTIENSGIFDSSMKFSSNDIQHIDMLDKIFEIEDNPSEYQLASTMFGRAVSINSAVEYLSDHGGLKNDTAVKLTLIAVKCAAKMNLSAAWDGDNNLVYYDYDSDTLLLSPESSVSYVEKAELEADKLINAVSNTYPEVLSATAKLLTAADAFIEQLEICGNPDTYTDDALQQLNSAISNISSARNEIYDFFANR
ncbi:hypothetical protein N510_000956 [Firmicutes bacterium ASF500]|nr:hypothetical protein N510_000956 [Firmicutes bacterium ASF500]